MDPVDPDSSQIELISCTAIEYADSPFKGLPRRKLVFRRAAGTPESLAKEVRKRGCQKVQDIVPSQLILQSATALDRVNRSPQPLL